MWIGSREASAPAVVAELEVNPVNGTACIDHDQYALEFAWDNASITLSQGEADFLDADPADWDVKNYASVEGDNDSSYAWVMKR